MGKYAGTQFSLFLVDGYNLAASLSESATMGKESLTEETMPFGVTSGQNTPLNIEKGELAVGGGFFDQATDALHAVTGSLAQTIRLVCAAIEDNVIGRHFMGFQGAYSQKYELMDKSTALTRANVTYLVSGDVNEGRIVQGLATFTADWDTKTGGAGVADAPVDNITDLDARGYPIASCSKANPGVVTMATENGSPIVHGLTTGQIILMSGNSLTGPDINTELTVTVLTLTTFSIGVDTSGSSGAGTGGSFALSSTVAGGVGYLQVTAYSGFTGFVDKIMHSPDDSTYATLITFTDLGSTHTPAKERKTVSGTVDRFLSNNGDVTGSGSVTAFSGFCRN